MRASVLLSKSQLTPAGDGLYNVKITSPLPYSYFGLGNEGDVLKDQDGNDINGDCHLSIDSFGNISGRPLNWSGADEKFALSGNIIYRSIDKASFAIPVA